jgi:hypothetical protein
VRDASVIGVLLAPDELPLLELADDAGEQRRIETQDVGQIRDPDPLAERDHREHLVLARRELGAGLGLP